MRSDLDFTSSRCGAWHMIGAQQMCVKRSMNECALTACANYLCKDPCTPILPQISILFTLISGLNTSDGHFPFDGSREFCFQCTPILFLDITKRGINRENKEDGWTESKKDTGPS